MSDLFSVYQYVKGDVVECVADRVDAKTAVETARSYTRRPAARLGFIEKVHIVSEIDDTVAFEWQFGKGVTFPEEFADWKPKGA